MVIKWIGFDVDECLANVTPAYYFVKAYGAEQLVSLLATSELEGRTWLLRSHIREIVEAVCVAIKQGGVYGAFLYSNNGSQAMVQFVRLLLNQIATQFSVDTPFKVGFHKDYVVRFGNNYKTYEDICNCLHVSNLPLPSDPKYLVFFDDRTHILKAQIDLYRKVPKYLGRTPVVKLALALEVLQKNNDDLVYHFTVVKAIQDEGKYELHIKPQEDQDPSVFIDTIHELCKVE